MFDVQVPDEASAIAEAKARVPSEPDRADPNGCRIGAASKPPLALHAGTSPLWCLFRLHMLIQ